MIKIVVSVIFLVLANATGASQQSPYAGQEQRRIKALSQTEIDGYLKGKGMGFAKAAELNHYPGPLHVLEIKDRLNLTDGQLKRTHIINRGQRAIVSNISGLEY